MWLLFQCTIMVGVSWTGIYYEWTPGSYKRKMNINPMHKAHAAPRCTAKSKRTKKPCRAPAVRGWKVCRMHGARGGAPEGKRNGNYRHGERSKETMALWKLIKSLR